MYSTKARFSSFTYLLFLAMILCVTITSGEIDTDDRNVSNGGSDDSLKTPIGKKISKELWAAISDQVRAWMTWVANHKTCALRPRSADIHEKITRAVHRGTKLIEYTLLFPRYSSNPLISNMTRVYKGNVWYRMTSKHGKTLLSLAQNYKLLSLTMLEFGVEKIDVDILDYPEGCLGKLPEDDKVNNTRDLLMNDFLFSEKDNIWLDDDDHVCHQVIEETPMKFGAFYYKCCMKTQEHGGILCMENELYDEWIAFLHGLLEAIRVLFLLFGPLIIDAWFYKGDMRCSVPYSVHLDEEYQCHMKAHALRSRIEGGGTFGRKPSTVRLEKLRNISPKVPFKKLRRRLKRQPGINGEMVDVAMKKLHIIVDHAKLMTQKDVPAGLFGFLNREIVLCRILNQEPLKSCSAVGCLLGSWSGRLLWIKLPGFKLPRVLNMLKWNSLIHVIGLVFLAVVLVPLPFHIRIIAYYFTEAQEMGAREAAVRSIGLRGPYIRSFWLGSLWPTGVVVIYAVYLVSIFVVGICRSYFYRAHRFDDVFQDCIADLHKVSYTSILRMLVAHLLLPLEKFGLLLGPIIAVPYYIIMLPFSLAVSMFYGIPTIYMIGRLVVNFRPNVLLQTFGKERNGLISLRDTTDGNEESDSDYDSKSDSSNISCSEEAATESNNITLSGGTKSCEEMFFLDIISPDTREYPRLPESRIRQRILNIVRQQSKFCSKYVRHVMAGFVSFMSIILILDILLMYAEAVRFFLEVIVLTLMGVIVNASFALDYFMLFFWTLIYCNTCFKNVYERYAQLTVKIFDFLKEEMKSKVADVTRVPEHSQTFTAFKYFTHQRMAELNKISKQFEDSDTDEEESCLILDRRERNKREGKDRLVPSKISGKVYWVVHNLVLFVSRDDTLRIPKQLFWAIVNGLKAPGCPGPLRQSLLGAMKQLTYMVLFLMFVFIIIMSFDQVTNISQSNQLLLTVISGFLPFIVRDVLMPKSPEVDLGEYSLKGKMEEILLRYYQKWPAYDLAGSVSTPEETSVHDTQPDLTDGGVHTTEDIDYGRGPPKVDVGQAQLDIPLLTPKYTVGTFAFWDGPVYRDEDDEI